MINEFDVSIIIVNYNSNDLLSNCIASIIKNVNCNYEVIIVDNNSSDNSFVDTKKKYKNLSNIIFHSSEVNLGFANANNLGFELSNGKLIHFLNPDTELLESINNDYGNIINEYKSNTIYVNHIIDINGNYFKSKNLIPILNNILKASIFNSKGKYWYTGASIIIWKYFFIEIGKWPIDYFMYSEDMDLFFKCYKHFGVVSELSNPIMHIGGGCSKNAWDSFQREIKVQNSLKIFYKKYNLIYQYYIFLVIIVLYKLFTRQKDLQLYLRAIKKVNFN